MKYWVFQSNQVLGPYGPDDLNGLDTFGAESLVCPEGRRGTSMGDWQRAGMVPDLSAALVKAAQGRTARQPVLTLAGLPAEPTLEDLAALGSLQEKTAMLEDAVLQLQESLRVKDAELTGLHQELAEKDKEAFELKQAVEARKTEAAALKDENADSRKRADEAAAAAEALRAEVEKRRAEAAQLQSRLEQTEKSVEEVRGLGDALDKAVEAEKKVEHDVEAHGATLGDLAREIEALRTQLQEKLASAPHALPSAVPLAPLTSPATAPIAPAAVPMPIATASVHFGAASAEPVPAVPVVPAPQDLPNIAPVTPDFLPPISASAAAPTREPAPLAQPSALPVHSEPPPPAVDATEHAPFAPVAGMAPLPAFGAEPSPAFAAAPPTFDPMSASAEPPALAAQSSAPTVEPAAVAPTAPSKKSRKPLLLIAGVVATLFAAAFVVLSGNGRRTKTPSPKLIAPPAPEASPVPAAPASVKSDAPLPTPSLSATAAAAGESGEAVTPSAPAVAVDPRQSAIDAARAWTLRDGTTLGEKLEALSPPSGNLTPWMAEPQLDGVVLVNYFAHAATGGPTVAYEFAVDPTAKVVSGRNAAAKAVLSGRATVASAPRKPVHIKVRPKAKPPAPKKAARARKPQTLDDVLSPPGTDAVAPPAESKPAPAAAKPAVVAKPAAPPQKQESLDDLLKE